MICKVKEKLKRLLFIQLVYITIFFWLPYTLSGFFIRNKKIWLISSPHGFEGNPKYFYLFYSQFLEKEFNIKLYWLTQSEDQKNDILNLGVKKAVFKNSLSGLFFSLIAKVHISSHGTWKTNSHLSKNMILVNLWHGIGIKNMKFKSQVDHEGKQKIETRLSRYRYPDLYRKYDLFLSTSELMTEHFAKCFRMKKSNFFISEYPRCKLFSMSEGELVHHIKSVEQEQIVDIIADLKKFDNVFIYMPTWRDTNPNFLANLDINWEGINMSLINKNNFLIVKAHPQSNADFLKQFSHITVLDPTIDVYPFLPFTSCLITDYSSIYFDYLLTNKNIVLFTFDYDEYVKNSRDFAYPFDENMIGYRMNKSSELETFFEDYSLLDMSSFMGARENVRSKFWAEDASELENFVSKILELAKD